MFIFKNILILIILIIFIFNYYYYFKYFNYSRSVKYFSYVEKQPPEVFCKKRYFWKFRKILRKTSVPESLFLIKLQASSAILPKKRL